MRDLEIKKLRDRDFNADDMKTLSEEKKSLITNSFEGLKRGSRFLFKWYWGLKRTNPIVLLFDYNLEQLKELTFVMSNIVATEQKFQKIISSITQCLENGVKATNILQSEIASLPGDPLGSMNFWDELIFDDGFGLNDDGTYYEPMLNLKVEAFNRKLEDYQVLWVDAWAKSQKAMEFWKYVFTDFFNKIDSWRNSLESTNYKDRIDIFVNQTKYSNAPYKQANKKAYDMGILCENELSKAEFAYRVFRR